MKIEYEATFLDIDKEEISGRLKKVGAKLVKPEFLQKRRVFDFPQGKEVKGGFVRVRDESDKVTLTVKIVDGNKITDQKETEIVVNNFDDTVSILETIGCRSMTYEESRRELWRVDDTDITIDTWPFLGVIVEVEGKSEEAVQIVAEKLGFNWQDAKFCTIGTLYKEKFGMGPIDLFRKTGQITELKFEGKNPFV